jgi:hypothetical protein
MQITTLFQSTILYYYMFVLCADSPKCNASEIDWQGDTRCSNLLSMKSKINPSPSPGLRRVPSYCEPAVPCIKSTSASEPNLGLVSAPAKTPISIVNSAANNMSSLQKQQNTPHFVLKVCRTTILPACKKICTID